MIAQHPTHPLIAKMFGVRDADGKFRIQGFHVLHNPVKNAAVPHQNGVVKEQTAAPKIETPVRSEEPVVVNLPDIAFGTTVRRSLDGQTSQFVKFDTSGGEVQVVTRFGKKMDRFPLDQLGTTYTY